MKLKFLLTALFFFSNPSLAEKYTIDTQGAHAFIQFKIQHLGYSWLYGRFDSFSGEFDYDEKNPSLSNIEVTVETNSVNSNHADRDKHLRSADFLDVKAFPQASFKSSSFTESENGNGLLKGDLTLHGVTKRISMDVKFVGSGKDPWGGFRRGYEATASIKLADFGVTKNLGPASEVLYLILSVEGVRH